MRARILTIIGVLAVTATISVPAQQIAPSSSRSQALPDGVLPGTKAAAFTVMQGIALSAANKPLHGRTVRLRDARVGRVVRTLLTDEEGRFAFQVIDPGSYVVELLAGERTVVATSALFHVNAGQTVNAVVREPMPLKSLESVIGFANAHAAAVTAAAATSGILGSAVSGDDVSPR